LGFINARRLEFDDLGDEIGRRDSCRTSGPPMNPCGVEFDENEPRRPRGRVGGVASG